MDIAYPVVTIDQEKIKSNVQNVVTRCNEKDIQVAGIIKLLHGNVDIASTFFDNGCAQVGSSRLVHLEAIKNAGVCAPLLLIRPPMMSEIDRVVNAVDYCVISSKKAVEAMEAACKAQGKTIKVIMAIEMGDLREGIWDRAEIHALAKYIVTELSCVKLAGIHVNMGCFGSIKTTPEKLNDFVAIGKKIEQDNGITLEIYSGGHTRELPMALDDQLPKEINHLRLGEVMVQSKWLREVLNVDYPFLQDNTVKLYAEIVEVETKPSKPIGEHLSDWAGNVPVFEDRGMRKRAILGIGRVDYVNLDQLLPVEDGIAVLGASSDHTIIDIEDCKRDLQVGDVLEFNLKYGSMVALLGAEGMNVTVIHKT